MTIKGSLLPSISIVKAFFDTKFSKSYQKLAENLRKENLGKKWGRNVKFCFQDPKRHILAQNDVIDVLIVKIGAGVLAVD